MGYNQGITAGEIKTVVRRLNKLDEREIPGRSNIAKEMGPGEFSGRSYELKVADDIGLDNIRRVSKEVGGAGAIGELDIIRKSGRVIEVTESFSSSKRSVFNKIQNKLEAMRAYDGVALDGNTLTIRAKEIINIEQIKDVIKNWEDTVRTSDDWGNADINIRLIDDDGNIIAGS